MVVKMKKIIKISVILLIFTLCLSFCVVKAYDSPQVVMVIRNGLVKNEWTDPSVRYTKINMTTQSYQNDDTFIALTNPCNNCQIKTRLIGQYNEQTVTTTRGTTKQYTNSLMNELGDYYIRIKRSDITLLTTYHYATWHLNG